MVETPLLEIQTPLIPANYIIEVTDLVLLEFLYCYKLACCNKTQCSLCPLSTGTHMVLASQLDIIIINYLDHKQNHT
jgi:hypothetical protein